MIINGFKVALHVKLWQCNQLGASLDARIQYNRDAVRVKERK
jgi:hypothetical protein